MISIFISAILFGLVHPGSKLILGQGISLVPFCLLYISIRLLVQIPIVIRTGEWRIKTNGQAAYLIILGLVGAGLQFSEFYGVSDGLPVAVVSFLVYTHPVWTLLLSRLINKEELTTASFIKIGLAVTGVALITGVHLAGSVEVRRLIVPLIAGVMIALWITVSNRASKEGCSTKSISFYYDLFALITLTSLSLKSTGTAGLAEAVNFMAKPEHVLLMAGYSIFVGLVPNYLFYFGSKTVPALTAGLILLLEPLVSTVVSNLAWGESVSPSFLLGALCILSTNAPSNILKIIQAKSQAFRSLRAAQAFLSGLFALAIVLLGLTYAVKSYASAAPAVHIIEVVPSDSSNYTVSAEMKQMERAFQMAADDYKKLNPVCKVSVAQTMKRGTEEELFGVVKGIAETNANSVVVGFSRSTFARVAAKAASGTTLRGIALGASTTNLRELNPNFVSIASPRTRQWAAIYSQMKSKSSCTPKNTLGVFDSKNHLSVQFKDDYLKNGFTENEESSPQVPEAFFEKSKGKSCIFIALNFSDAQVYLETLLASQWKGSVFGIGDWNMFSNEVRKVLHSSSYSGLVTYMPTGWESTVSSNSKAFSERMKIALGEAPSPVGAYSYDAMIVALDSACKGSDIAKPSPAKLARLKLLRKYEGIADTGNYLSQMLLVKAQSGGML